MFKHCFHEDRFEKLSDIKLVAIDHCGNVLAMRRCV